MQLQTSNAISDLWKGEQQILFDIASGVQESGTIVEIGTFRGGTAQLLHAATQGRNVKIFTIDISPLAQAKENLKNTDVELIAISSHDAAQEWHHIGGTIDLLFIDGGHKFEDVYADFCLWSKYFNPGGIVVFHDYDPIERGGVVHFAVQILVDTIRRLGLLTNVNHKYRLLYGSLGDLEKIGLDVKSCYETLAESGSNLNTLFYRNYAGYTLIADDRFSNFLKICLPLHECDEIWPPVEVTDLLNKFLVSAHPLGLPVDFLKERGVDLSRLEIVDSFKACYLLDFCLKSHFERLLDISNNRSEFMRCNEARAMIDHAYGVSQFPYHFPDVSNMDSVSGLSKIIAQEQIKLNLLARMLKTFIDWTP